MVEYQKSQAGSSLPGNSGDSKPQLTTGAVTRLASTRKDPLIASPGHSTPWSTFYWTTVSGSPCSLRRRNPRHADQPADVHAVVPYLALHCAIVGESMEIQKGMVTQWLRLALTDKGLVCGVLLSACRHLALYRFEDQQLRQLSLAYKLECLQALQKAISTDAGPIGDTIR